MASYVTINCSNCKNSCMVLPMPVSQIRSLAEGNLECKRIALEIIHGELIFGICQRNKKLVHTKF